MFYVPLAALLVVSLLFRSDLGLKGLAAYWSIWLVGLLVAVALAVPPGYFIALQALLAVGMMIQLRINPRI